MATEVSRVLVMKASKWRASAVAARKPKTRGRHCSRRRMPRSPRATRTTSRRRSISRSGPSAAKPRQLRQKAMASGEAEAAAVSGAVAETETTVTAIAAMDSGSSLDFTPSYRRPRYVR